MPRLMAAGGECGTPARPEVFVVAASALFASSCAVAIARRERFGLAAGRKPLAGCRVRFRRAPSNILDFY